MAGIYSVTQVNAYIRNMFVQDYALNRISVKGEVSNCKYHSSGHIYFTLKDAGGTLSAVMFATHRTGLKFRLQEGMSVVVSGNIDVYERDGKYQLYAKEISLTGMGDLYEKFVKLRDELEEMGMFSEEYKKPLPKYAHTVGIVTAATGAAIRDIMNIAARRNPYVQLILYPALVQGRDAKYSIIEGIKTLDAMDTDVIIVGRGGGSIEDLWAFNEECVARAIFECSTPIISAVGHETDVTIADYVADLRAPTPSAAAELAVFDYKQFVDELENSKMLLKKYADYAVMRTRHQLEEKVWQLSRHDPMHEIEEKRQRLDDFKEKLDRFMEKILTEKKHKLALLSGQLEGLSPLAKLGQGYGFVTNDQNKRIDTVSKVKKGDNLFIQLPDGKISAAVTKIEQTVW